MLPPNILLVSEDPELICAVQQVHHENCSLGLELCGMWEKAHSRMRCGGIALVLVHVTRDRPADMVWNLLRIVSADRLAKAALICKDENAEKIRVTCNDAEAELLRLPTEAGKLIRILNQVAAMGFPVSGTSEINKRSRIEFVEPMYEGQIGRVSVQDTTVLLTGETGTGKTTLARQIHEASPRRGRPFVIVDCGALATSVIESEMFGHVRGAFTGADRERIGKLAAAADGTLVLDEINSLPLALQGKLLRAVEERVIEPVGSNRVSRLCARIIAIANTSLAEEITRERFRADLYYRLSVVDFRLRPLRDRGIDIIQLAFRFVNESDAAKARGLIGIAPDAQLALEGYFWPGNVRELRNAIERAAALGNGSVITVADLPEAIRESAQQPAAVATVSVGGREDEARRIAEALRNNRNNRVRAAAELGISRVTLYKKMHQHGLFASTNSSVGRPTSRRMKVSREKSTPPVLKVA